MNNHRNKKNNKLRYSEYYGMQEAYDNLYQRSVENQNFKSLMKIIISDDNILLAYRNIKRNSGSLTAGIDGKTIKDIEKLTTERYLDIVKKRFKFYKPRKVKRTEILHTESETEDETQIANTIRDERFLRSGGGKIFVEIMGDQHVGTEAHELPENKRHQKVVGDDNAQDGEHEDGETGKETSLRGVIRHVANREQVNPRGDERDHEEH